MPRAPAPFPGFSRTPGAIQHGHVGAGERATEALRDWGLGEATLSAFKDPDSD